MIRQPSFIASSTLWYGQSSGSSGHALTSPPETRAMPLTLEVTDENSVQR